MRRPRTGADRRRPAGFTLVEMLVVIAIIGLIVSLVLVAAADGVRRAEERATQALITKLEQGVADRLDALLNNQAPVNQTHRYLASINFNNGSGNIPVGSSSVALSSEERRAQVIAQFDYLRSELPDVFFVNADTKDGPDYSAAYPLNFGGVAYPLASNNIYNKYLLPLGNLAPGLPYYNDPTNPFNISNSSTWTLTTNPTQGLQLTYGAAAPLTPPTSGIFGASFTAIGGITKNLGYAATGYDGVDNNNNLAIDDMAEGVPSGTDPTTFANNVAAALAKHKHKTARAEMLYAVLVEGVGPLGSVFTRDEFTAREVQDTDGDGLPEFVDAWGEPLQFYRWPIYYGVDGVLTDGSGLTTADQKTRLGSDTQKGANYYVDYSERRDQSQLDPNQLLVSPGWWAALGNVGLPTSNTTTPTFGVPNTGGNYGISQGAMAFMQYFQLLVDPRGGDTTAGSSWDRTGNYSRRAYFSKFLILSGGPDKEPGVGQFAKDYTASIGDPTVSTTTFAFPNKLLTMDQNAIRLILIENQASQTDPSARTGSYFEVPQKVDNIGVMSTTSAYLQNVYGLDDISNHNIQAPTTGVR